MNPTFKNFLTGTAFAAIMVIVLGLMILGVIAAHRAEKAFKTECVAVAGRVVYDDNELECHKNGFEIAEYGENSPRNPVWNDRVG